MKPRGDELLESGSEGPLGASLGTAIGQPPRGPARGTLELVIVERAGQRLALPAAHVSMIGELPNGSRTAPLQERLGQPPPDDAERCVAIAVRTPDGHALVPVAGRVTIATVDADDVAPLPALLADACPVTAVVFGDGAPVLILDVEEAVARGRAEP